MGRENGANPEKATGEQLTRILHRGKASKFSLSPNLFCMNIPLNYYHADDFPEIAAEQEGYEDDFVNARLEEVRELYSSEYPNIRALQSIVHRLFRREFPIQKQPSLGYANSGETVREFAFKRYEKLKKFVRSMDLEREMDKHELFDFCNRIERQLLSGQYEARRIEFFEESGEFWWDLHPTEKKQRVEPKAKTATITKEGKTLPPLEDAFKGDVLELWQKLAAMPRPLVSKLGVFKWEGGNVSVLKALAQALVTADLINGGHKAESVYRILCRHWGIKEADRPRITGKRGLTYRYTDHLTEFDSVLTE